MKATETRKFQGIQQPFAQPVKRVQLPIAGIRRRLRWLQWIAPIGMALIVILYEFGPANWIHTLLGSPEHHLAEILFYGTIGPALIFFLLNVLGRWMEERETSELQALVLAQAQEHARLSHEVTDDALQALFAASVMLSSLESQVPDLPPEIKAQLRQTNRALDPIMQQLYAHQAKRPMITKR